MRMKNITKKNELWKNKISKQKNNFRIINKNKKIKQREYKFVKK